MNLLSNIFASFFGGIFIGNPSKLFIVIRLAIYFIILSFFEIFLNINCKIEENPNDIEWEMSYFITAMIFTIFVFLIKLISWFINLFKPADELSDSMESKSEERPDHIPPDVWQLRDTIIKSKKSQDLVISDLLASGVDSNDLMNLVNYIQRNDRDSQLSFDKMEDSKDFVINICGKSYYTKINPESFNKIFPPTPSILIVVYSAFLCFSSTFFSLSIKNQLLPRERWWVAIVCSISIYSILYPVDSDPYSTRIPDTLTGCSRPLALSIITGLWQLVIHYDYIYFIHKIHNQKPLFSISFLYNISINWEILSPYLNDTLKYCLILLPFLVFIGLIGHPFSSIISIFESFNRYFFGQNGVSNLIHLIIQLIRGAGSVAINWALLNFKFTGATLSIAVAISTLLGTFPFIFNVKKASSKIMTICYTFLLAALSFLLSFCLVHLAGNRWDIISWSSFGWILIVDVLYPYFSSNEKYFFFHFRLFHSFRGSILLRNFTQLFVTPLFISSVLHYSNKYIHYNSDSFNIDISKRNERNELALFSFNEQDSSSYSSNDLPKLIISLAIVHGIQKSNSEPHIFAFAIWLTVLTLPYEFDLQFPAVNFIISLLIVSKLEIFIPQAELAFRSRNVSFLFKNIENKSSFFYPIFIQIFTIFFQMLPMPDLLLKIPSLIWSFITGASFISIKGISTLLSFSPIRPTYFFDWPVSEDHDLESVFTQKVGECPIEAPVYLSVSYSLSSKLATIIRSGRLGLVSNGDIFLMQENTSLLTVIIHIIAIEPYCIKMQIRGLEYTNRTLCHAEEDLFLFELINGYQNFPNFFASSVASCAAYDVRALGLPLKIYESSKTNVQEAFLGLEPSLNVKIMIASYCYSYKQFFSHLNINVQSEFQRLPDDFAESEKVQLFYDQQNLEYISESLKESCALNDEEISLLHGLFVVICSSVLDSSGNFLVNKDNSENSLNVVDFFNGNIEISEEFSWIFDVQSLFSEFILPIVRIAIVTGFLASSGLLDDDESVEDIECFVDEVCHEYVITTINSPMFRSTFTGRESNSDYSSSFSSSLSSSISSKSSDQKSKSNNDSFGKSLKRKKIISLMKINDEDVILRFSKNPVKWNVLKLKREWVRALWGNDTMDILFYGNTNSERMSIQYNKLFLNNMILQACDSPIGYPAYVSKIMDSYLHIGSIQKFQT